MELTVCKVFTGVKPQPKPHDAPIDWVCVFTWTLGVPAICGMGWALMIWLVQKWSWA